MTNEVCYFTLDINPASLTTAQEKGVRIVKTKSGKTIPTFFKKKAAVENEKVLTEHILQAKEMLADKFPIKHSDDYGVRLEVTYYFPHPSGTPKKKNGVLSPMTRRPDVDNISKAVVDCMTNCGLWDDDSQISDLRLTKCRSPHPRISVAIFTYNYVFTEEDK